MTADNTLSPVVMAAGEAAASSASPAPAKRYKGIAIVGSNPLTKFLAPFDDPDWLIWACSPSNSPHGLQDTKLIPRWDAWFELHRPVAHPTRPFGYLNWLKDNAPVLYMRDATGAKFFPGAKPYPDKAMKAEFGPFIFTSSIAYMQALAIFECQRLSIPMIGLYGILQAHETEYNKHKIGTQQFIFEAKKRGISTGVPTPDQIKATDDNGNLRQEFLVAVQALKELFSPPAEDW